MSETKKSHRQQMIVENMNTMQAEVVSSRVYPFIVDVNFEKDSQEITGGRKFKFNVRDAIWYVGIKITAEKSGIMFTVNRKNNLATFQIVCSILNYPELGTITLTSHDVEKPLKFFDWNDIKKIQENSDSMQLCFNFIDLTMGCNPIDADCVMTKQARMLELFESGKFSDFLIKTEEKDFKVHKIVLSARSPVFDAMFRSDMKEAKTGVVTIKNVRPAVLEELLLFMYADVTTRLPEMPYEMFAAAHLYEVQDLERLCIEYMSTHMCVENVTGILTLCDKYALEELREAVLKFVVDNEKFVVKRDEYLIYLMETLKVDNVVGRLKLAQKYMLIELKQFLMEFVATNYKDVIKNKDYREMYRNQAAMSIVLEVDEYMSNYHSRVKDEPVAPAVDSNNTNMFLSILIFLSVVIHLYLAFN